MEINFSEIKPYLFSLLESTNEIQDIWLFGSQVNPKSTPPSDWDLLVFSNEDGFQALKNREDLNNKNVDVLIVIDGDYFEEPWFVKSENRRGPKRGNLSSWKWKLIDDNIADYDCTKPQDFDLDIKRTCKAYKIYSQKSFLYG